MDSNPYAERKERNCLVPSAFTLLLAVVLLVCVGSAPPAHPPLHTPLRASLTPPANNQQPPPPLP
jgi:hypothetical protein